MIRLEMKNYIMILIEKQLKYQLYHQAKFINMNILLVKIYYHLSPANNNSRKKIIDLLNGNARIRSEAIF